MKIINLSRVGIPKKSFLKDFFCPKFASKVTPKIAPKVAPNVSLKSPNKAVSMIPPKAVHKSISSKFLTKLPISVTSSHLVVTLSLYIFGIVCF